MRYDRKEAKLNLQMLLEEEEGEGLDLTDTGDDEGGDTPETADDEAADDKGDTETEEEEDEEEDIKITDTEVAVLKHPLEAQVPDPVLSFSFS